MTKMLYADAFRSDLEKIYSSRLRAEIIRLLGVLEATPDVGSHLVPASILEKYGPNIRKAVVGPYDLIYRFDCEKDEVRVYRLLAQRAIKW